MASEVFPIIYLLALSSGVVAAATSWGRAGRTASGLGWALFLVSLVLAAFVLSDEGPAAWQVPMISLGEGALQLSVGFFLDRAGVAASMLVGLILAYVFLLEPLFIPSGHAQSGGQRAAVLAAAGVSLGWLSDGLWGILLAQMLAAAAGWVVLRWDAGGASDSSVGATSFSRERAAGLVFSLLGLGVLAARGASLSWSAVGGFSAAAAPVGIVLITFGAILQMGVFPALAWPSILTKAQPDGATHLLLVSSPSAWVAFAALYRLAADFEGTELTAWLVGPTLLFSVLTAWFALSAARTGAKLIGIAGAASGISVALLMMAGRTLGATSFWGFQLLLWASALVLRERTHRGGKVNGPNRSVRILLMMAWSGGGLFFSGAVLAGAIAGLRGPLDAVSLALAWVMLSLAALDLFAAPPLASPAAERKAVSGWRHSMSAVLLLLSLAVSWSGAADGSFAGSLDSAIGPAMSLWLFGEKVAVAGQKEQLILWGWTVALIFLVLLRLPEKISKSGALSWVVAGSGYGLRRGVSELSERSQSVSAWISRQLQGRRYRKILEGPARGLAELAVLASGLDLFARERIDRLARGLVEIPAKGLQLIQGGSLQVYLLFTVGFALALLLHFWGHITL